MLALRSTLVVSVLFVACRTAPRPSPFLDGQPSHVEVTPSSVFGDWVLFTVAERGELGRYNSVQLSLSPSAFVLTASAPKLVPLIVTGTAVSEGNGLGLILTPRSITRAGQSLEHAGGLVVGLPVRLVASAAGGTMIVQPPFALPEVASSIWHRREASIAAGDPGAPAMQSAGGADSTAPE